VLVLVALAWQVQYATDTAACGRDGQFLCQGPLDGWVLPVTLVFGLALVAVGAIGLARRD
jgi:hypothetical protein